MSIQEAIQLNNQVISLLENKLFNNAATSSFAALQMFQQYQQTLSPEVSLQQQDKDSVDRFIVSNRDRRCSNDTVEGFIFEDGIVLPTDATDVPVTVTTSVLIFNCALSHHLLARHCSDDRESHRYLERAKTLYRLAYGQLDQDKNEVFRFVIANNVGVIDKSLGNYEESKHCFEQLVALMIIYVDYGMVDGKRLAHIQGFWRNVMGNGSTAPAA